MKQNTNYFPHDFNAAQDEKCLALVAEHGWEGYGVFWKIIEMLYMAPTSRIENRFIKALAFSMNMPLERLTEIVQSCQNIGLFESDGNSFFSTSVLRRKQVREQRSEAAKASAGRRWNADKMGTECERNANAMRTQCEPNAIKEKKRKESIKEKLDKKKSDATASEQTKSFRQWTKEDLLADIAKHREKYPPDLLNNFYRYWSEADPRGKIRASKESTWETHLRLANWHSRQLTKT